MNIMSENTLKPIMRFKGFNDDWELRKLGELITSFSGGTPSAGNSSYYKGDIPFIRSGEINSDKTELFLTEAGLKNSSAKMVSVGDVLYALYGATSGEVGISQINGAINQAILAIKPCDGYNSHFIMQWLKLQKSKIIDKYLQGGQGNLSGSIVKNLVLNVPNFEEQQKIGAFFKQLDDTITLHQHELTLLKQSKKAFLQKMFPKKGERNPELRFQEFKETWKLRQMSELVTERNEQIPESEDFPLMSFTANEGVTPKSDRYNREFLVKNKNKKYKKTLKGDLIYSSNNLDVGSIGINKRVNAVISPVYSIFYTQSGITSEYINLMIKRNEFINKMLRYRQGVVYGQYRIHEGNFLKIKDYIPSQDEQIKIGNFFKELDDSITLQEQKIEALKQMKKAFLQKMFV